MKYSRSRASLVKGVGSMLGQSATHSGLSTPGCTAWHTGEAERRRTMTSAWGTGLIGRAVGEGGVPRTGLRPKGEPVGGFTGTIAEAQRVAGDRTRATELLLGHRRVLATGEMGLAPRLHSPELSPNEEEGDEGSHGGVHC